MLKTVKHSKNKSLNELEKNKNKSWKGFPHDYLASFQHCAILLFQFNVITLGQLNVLRLI